MHITIQPRMIMCYRSTDSSDSDSSTGRKESKVFVDQPIFDNRQPSTKVTQVCPSVVAPAAYVPDYTEILIDQSEMDMLCLMEKFGEKFSESFCTPRVITLDLSDDLDASRKSKFYLVLALRAEGDAGDIYR